MVVFFNVAYMYSNFALCVNLDNFVIFFNILKLCVLSFSLTIVGILLSKNGKFCRRHFFANSYLVL